MILHHISQSTGLVIVTAAFFDPQLFCKGNLDIVNVVTIPDVFKEKIGEADSKDALNHFLA